MYIPCYRDNKVPKKSDSRHSSGKRMLFLFPCGCEADSSAPAEPTFSMLTRETSSTVGSENWGTLTETLPMMLFLKWSWNWSLKQQERKIYQDQHLSHNLANLYQYTIHVKNVVFWIHRQLCLPILGLIPRCPVLERSREVTWLRMVSVEITQPFSCRVLSS